MSDHEMRQEAVRITTDLLADLELVFSTPINMETLHLRQEWVNALHDRAMTKLKELEEYATQAEANVQG